MVSDKLGKMRMFMAEPIAARRHWRNLVAGSQHFRWRLLRPDDTDGNL